MSQQAPLLTTGRTRLRSVCAGDFDALVAIHANPEVMRFLGVGPARGRPRSPAETWGFMQNTLGQWPLRGYGLWAIEDRATGTLIGRAGILHPYDWPEPELAYTLDQPCWGRGLAVEVITVMRGWAFATQAFPRLVSFIDPENTASRRVAAKLGAVLDGRIELQGHVVERWVHHRPGSGPIV